MSTLKVDNIQDTGGNDNVGQEYIAFGSAKAIARINSTGTTIDFSHNVTSYTDTGTGEGTVNITNAFTAITDMYAPFGLPNNAPGAGGGDTSGYNYISTTSAVIQRAGSSSASADFAFFDYNRAAVVFGDLA